MKVSVDVDCTPEEARRFLGLPDLSPVHQAYVDRMTKMVTEGGGSEAFGDMMKSWAPMSEASMGMWRQMMENMASGAAGGVGAGKR